MVDKMQSHSRRSPSLNSSDGVRLSHPSFGAWSAQSTYSAFEDAKFPDYPRCEPASPEVQERAKRVFEDIITVLPFTDSERQALRDSFPPIVRSYEETSFFYKDLVNTNVAGIAIKPEHENNLPVYYEECGHYIRETLMPHHVDLEANERLVRLMYRQKFLERWLGPFAVPFRWRCANEMKITTNKIDNVHEFFGCLLRGLSPTGAGGQRDVQQSECALDTYSNPGSGGLHETHHQRPSDGVYGMQHELDSATQLHDMWKKMKRAGLAHGNIPAPKTRKDFLDIKRSIDQHDIGYLAASLSSEKLLISQEGRKRLVEWFRLPSVEVYRRMITPSELRLHEARKLLVKNPNAAARLGLEAIEEQVKALKQVERDLHAIRKR